jgi:predicted lipoprotein
MPGPSFKRRFIVPGAVLVGLVLTYWFPLFRIVPLEQVAAANANQKFDAAAFAKDFWSKQLVPSFEQATDAAELIPAIQSDPETARKTFGKSVGIGRVYYYFLRGVGTVTAVDKSGVHLSMTDQPDVVLKTGLLFGNTIRDATGQLIAGNFANSQDFNAVSKELNRIVEKDIQPALKSQAQVGAKIRFVGCAEVRASNKKILPLTVIPLQVEFPE